MERLRVTWMRLPESVRWCVAAFLVARVLFWLWGGLVMTLIPISPQGPFFQPAVPAPSGWLGWALAPWNRWDVFWYTRIAVQGYGIPDGRGAFAPLFPLLIAVLGRVLGGQYLMAAFVVSDACCLGSLILLYEVAQRDVQRGRRAVVALLIYPFAFFLFIPYTESLLLLLTLTAFLAARSGRWWLVGVCCALAVLTKTLAVVLLVPMAWELWKRRDTDALWKGLWLTLPVLAFMGWLVVRDLFFNVQAGPSFASPYGLLTPFLSSDFAVAWNNAVLSWPWNSLIAAVLAPFRLWPHLIATTAVIDLATLLGVLFLAILVFRLPRQSYGLYVLAVIVMSLIMIVKVVPLQDAPRRWLLAFPLFTAAAAYVPRRWERPLIYLSLLLQVLLSALFVKWAVVA